MPQKNVLIKQGFREPRIWILACVCVWWALSLHPFFLKFTLSLRWPLAIGLGVVGMVLFALNSYKFQRRTKIFCWTICGFIFLCAFSILNSALPNYSFLRFGALVLLLGFSVFGGSAFFSTPSGLIAGIACIALNTAIILFLIFTAGFGETLEIEKSQYRFQGNSTLKATGAGTSLVCAVPFLLWCTKYFSRIYLIPLRVILVYTVILVVATKTKVAVGSLLVILPASVVAMRSVKISRGGMLVAIILLVSGVAINNSSDLRRVLRLENDSVGQDVDLTTGRSQRWVILVNRGIEEALFFGKGPGMSRYHHISDDKVEYYQDGQIVAHNEHLAVFYEYGIFGLFLFWIVLGRIIHAGVIICRSPLGVYRDVVVVVFISWCATLVDTISHDAYLTVGNPEAFIFWLKGTLVICGGSMLKHPRLRQHQKSRRSRSTPIKYNGESAIY